MKQRYIKLGELPQNWILDGRHFKLNKKLKIKSGWNKGLWLQADGEQRIYPMFFENFDDIKDKMISISESEYLEITIREGNRGKKTNKKTRS